MTEQDDEEKLVALLERASVDFEPETLARVDELAEDASTASRTVTRSEMLLELLVLGLERAEREYAAPRSRRRLRVAR
jgi:predicted RecB family endonuclease